MRQWLIGAALCIGASFSVGCGDPTGPPPEDSQFEVTITSPTGLETQFRGEQAQFWTTPDPEGGGRHFYIRFAKRDAGEWFTSIYLGTHTAGMVNGRPALGPHEVRRDLSVFQYQYPEWGAFGVGSLPTPLEGTGQGVLEITHSGQRTIKGHIALKFYRPGGVYTGEARGTFTARFEGDLAGPGSRRIGNQCAATLHGLERLTCAAFATGR